MVCNILSHFVLNCPVVDNTIKIILRKEEKLRLHDYVTMKVSFRNEKKSKNIVLKKCTKSRAPEN